MTSYKYTKNLPILLRRQSEARSKEQTDIFKSYFEITLFNGGGRAKNSITQITYKIRFLLSVYSFDGCIYKKKEHFTIAELIICLLTDCDCVTYCGSCSKAG